MNITIIGKGGVDVLNEDYKGKAVWTFLMKITIKGKCGEDVLNED